MIGMMAIEDGRVARRQVNIYQLPRVLWCMLLGKHISSNRAFSIISRNTTSVRKDIRLQ